MKDPMSTIERAAQRLGTVSRRTDPDLSPIDASGHAGPIERATSEVIGIEGTRLDSVVQMPATGPVYGEPRTVALDLDRLSARGFATPANAQTPLATEFRRIKRPLLLKVKSGSTDSES